MNYNSTLQTNNSSLEEIITQLNNLPDAGGSGEITNLAQTLGDSETLAISQKAVTDNIDAILSAFETTGGHNLLDPNNVEVGYYINESGVLVKGTSRSCNRTVAPIRVDSDKIYVTTNLPATHNAGTAILATFVLDAEGVVVKFVSRRLSNLINDGVMMIQGIPDGGAIHLYINDINASNWRFSNVCVSASELEEYEEYSKIEKPKRLKNGFLPDEDENFSLNVINLKDEKIKMLVAPLKDKVIVNFGDSLFGNYRGADSISSVLANYTGATVYNCGFGGCRMASHSIVNFDAFSMYRLADAIASQTFTTQDTAVANGKTATTEAEGKLPTYFEETLDVLKSIDFNSVDIITIAYGTNDFMGGKTLDNDDNRFDTTKFAGALRHSIETILGTYPHIRIFICSQTYRFWMDGEGAFMEDADTKTLTGGKLTDFVAKTKGVAEAYHLPYIDNYYELGMNKFNRTVYFSATDGTHPNAAGRELLARHIASKLF